jgi:hypothetical protein
MREKILAIVLIVAAIGLISLGLITLAKPVNATVVNVSTDRDLYHSNEVMAITVTVTSPGGINNATLKFDGLQDNYGRERLSHDLTADLPAGETNVTYDYNLPPCSICAGLSPGNYSFNVSLISGNSVLSNMTHSIRIEQ